MYRRLNLTGAVYLQAPQQSITEFMNELAAAKKMPPRDNRRPYGCEGVMASGGCLQMLQHRETAEQCVFPDFDVNVYVTQNPSFCSLMCDPNPSLKLESL